MLSNFRCERGHMTVNFDAFPVISCPYLSPGCDKLNPSNYCGLYAMPVDPFSYDEDDSCSHNPGAVDRLVWVFHLLFPTLHRQGICRRFNWVQSGGRCPRCS